MQVNGLTRKLSLIQKPVQTTIIFSQQGAETIALET